MDAFNYESRFARIWVYTIGILFVALPLLPIVWLSYVWDEGVRIANQEFVRTVVDIGREYRQRWTGDDDGR